MPGSDEVWDAGLQPERTALAWQRTSLTIVGLGLVVPRFGWASFGPWSLALAALPVVSGAFLLVFNHRRYRQVHFTLTSGGTHVRDGRLVLLAALTASFLGLIALVTVGTAVGS